MTRLSTFQLRPPRLHPESDLQRDVIRFWALQYPATWALTFHCPSGVAIDPKRAAIFRGLGWKRGVPDLLCFARQGRVQRARPGTEVRPQGEALGRPVALAPGARVAGLAVRDPLRPRSRHQSDRRLPRKKTMTILDDLLDDRPRAALRARDRARRASGCCVASRGFRSTWCHGCRSGFHKHTRQPLPGAEPTSSCRWRKSWRRKCTPAEITPADATPPVVEPPSVKLSEIITDVASQVLGVPRERIDCSALDKITGYEPIDLEPTSRARLGGRKKDLGGSRTRLRRGQGQGAGAIAQGRRGRGAQAVSDVAPSAMIAGLDARVRMRQMPSSRPQMRDIGLLDQSGIGLAMAVDEPVRLLASMPHERDVRLDGASDTDRASGWRDVQTVAIATAVLRVALREWRMSADAGKL